MGGSHTIKSYVCLRCRFEFKYYRMVEFCPNCGAKGSLQKQMGFKMNKEKAMKLIGQIETEFNCSNSGYQDELADRLTELKKWIDYNIK